VLLNLKKIFANQIPGLFRIYQFLAPQPDFGTKFSDRYKKINPDLSGFITDIKYFIRLPGIMENTGQITSICVA